MADDTFYAMDYADAKRVFAEEGFETVAQRDFTSASNVGETQILLWHPDGILGVLESYSGTWVNQAQIFYNIDFPPSTDRWKVTGSGHQHGPTLLDGHYLWVGSHDVRDRLRDKLADLRSAGTFHKQWAARPHLWLVAYIDARRERYDYKDLNEAAIATLPENVRTAITPANEEN
jgi:hypothetical protein